MTKVLIVEDSPSTQKFLSYILGENPELTVIGIVSSGEEAILKVKELKPDVITMDVHLSGINGFETTKRIMQEFPTPIVIVSSAFNKNDIQTTFRTLEAGALAFVEKPTGILNSNHEVMKKELIETVKLMSEVKVVRRFVRLDKEIPVFNALAAIKEISDTKIMQREREIKIVAIGASTGGPIAVQSILSKLSYDFSIPVVIVQHIAKGFTEGFKEWLCSTTKKNVKVAFNGEMIRQGFIYIAPEGTQIGILKDGIISLKHEKAENFSIPSVSYLFRSVADTYGKNAVGILLTGMGKDGADGLKLMKDKGAIAIAQDKESSTVFGMPKEAIKIGAAGYILSVDKISEFLKVLFNSQIIKERRQS